MTSQAYNKHSNKSIENKATEKDMVQVDHTLAIAVIIAVGFHMMLVFGISFTTGANPSDIAEEVATSFMDNMQENLDANFIANASQEGGGSSEEKVRIETAQISPLNAEEVQKTQDIINQQKQIRQHKYQQSYLSTTLSWKEVDKEHDNENDNEQSDIQEQQDRIRQEIATLEAQLSQQEQVLAAKTKVETVDSNSTTYNKTSAFLENFRRHVEATATQYYPAQAIAQGISGDVRLMVVIKSDGSVKAIRLLESSGYSMLDEAAKQSVRQSAPYGKFTKEMEDIVELRIIRTWRYSGTIRIE